MSSEPHISPELQSFIKDRFDSIESIELALLLRNAPGQFHSVDKLSSLLRSNFHSINYRLANLHIVGLVTSETLNGESVYRYAPVDQKADMLMEELAQNYIVRRFQIINLLYSGSLEKLHSFAAAFDFKGEEPGND